MTTIHPPTQKTSSAPTANASAATADGEGRPQSIRPMATMPPAALIAVLVAIAGFGLMVYSFFPDNVGGPSLPLKIEVGSEPVASNSGPSLLTPVVAVTNRGEDPIGHLAVIINKEYQLIRESPLEPGQRLVFPQSIFTNKRSSRRFNPRGHSIEKVVVRGQLASGTRGVTVVEFDREATTD